MGMFAESPFALNGCELNIQDALTAIDRVLRDGQVADSTRVMLEAARRALRDETD